MTPIPKDVFLIHTKGDEPQRFLADLVIQRLPPYGVEVWAYDDWNWERHQADPGKKVFKRQGLRIDPRRFLLRDPKPFVHPGRTLEVDRETVREILRHSVVIALFEPRKGSPSAGVALEHTLLQELIARPSLFRSGFPLLLRFPWEGSDSGTFTGLPISTHYKLPEIRGQIPENTLTDVLAIIYAAFLIHTLQHSTAGHYILSLAGESNSLIKTLVKGTRSYQALDFQDLASQSRHTELQLRSIAARKTADWDLKERSRIDLGMAELAMGNFDDWWKHTVPRVREFVSLLPIPTAFSVALTDLVTVTDASWRNAWKSFLYCNY